MKEIEKKIKPEWQIGKAFGDKNKVGIYCHIPFCVKKCEYCDFNSQVCRDSLQVDAYFKALMQEIRLTAGKEKLIAETIYIGGGTPSSVAAKKIAELIEVLREVFIFDKDLELTIEVNPGTVTREKLSIYKEVGINRISVGLQAWQDKLLKSLGRIHDQKQFIKTMELLKALDFYNFSVDIMYGLPGQSLEMLEETLKEVLAFKPMHLSCYSLILEEDTPMTRKVEDGVLCMPTEDLERKMHWLIDKVLKNADYDHYEISSYAKKGYESRHNLKYWELVPYLGFGAGAHGFYQGIRYANEPSVPLYIKAIKNNQGIRIEEDALKEEDAQAEFMFLGLRKLGGVDRKTFSDRFGCDFTELYREEIGQLLDQKLVVFKGESLKLTAKGQDFANLVFMAFV